MLDRLIEFSLRQRILVLLLVVLIIALGWRAWNNTPIDAFPDISTTQVKVIIKAPGMTPEEVEARITNPVEVEMLGLPKLTIMRSTTKYALTDITLDFNDSTDIYWARNQVNERLSNLWSELPEGISGGVAPLTTPLGEMFMFTIEGGDLTLMQRRELLDWVIRPALRSVSGVADVNALGGHVRSYTITPRTERMQALGIGIDELLQAIRSNNRNDGAGRLHAGEETLLVRTLGSVTDLQDLGNIVVRADTRQPVRVNDIATLSFAGLTRYGGVTRDGRAEAVEGLVLGLRGANARAVVAGVKQKLAEISDSLPEAVSVRVFYDRSRLVDTAVATVSDALLQAIALVIVLLLVFLADWRSTLVVATVLPLAALMTFIGMQWTGLSANLMSLGGLAIAIGLLVDGAIVVVENIAARLREQGSAQLPRLHVIYRASSEVAVPVTAGVAIIVIVFLPLLSLQGLEGKLFAPVAQTLIYALVSAWILAMMLMPVLSSLLLRRKQNHSETAMMQWLAQRYRTVLQRSMQSHRQLLLAAAVMMLLTVLLFVLIGKTFMPTMDEGDIIVQLEKVPTITLEQSLKLDMRVQRALLQAVDEIEGIVARAGSDEIGLDPMGLNETDSFLVLKPRREWQAASKAELINKIRAVLDGFPGIGHTFTQPIQMRVDEMLTGVRGDLAIKIFGPDQDTLNRLAEQAVQALQDIPGAAEVYTPANDGAQYLQFNVDRLAAGRMGVSADEISALLKSQLEGLQAGIVYEGNKRIPVQIRSGDDVRGSALALKNIQVTGHAGQWLSLNQLVSSTQVEGPVSIIREHGTRRSVIIANVSERDLVGFVDEARARLDDVLQLPAGYFIEYGGEFENQQRAAQRLLLVVPVALGLVFLILFTVFRSVSQAVLIISNVPLALFGGILALYVSGHFLSVPASVGFVALMGIAVMNGIVLVSHFNELRALGMPLERLVIEGAQRRLKPVLMTASITAFGLLPLMLASGPGSEIQKPLAIVVIGGVVSSTLLTLLILPVMFARHQR
ncbi:MAG: CusA/CzcA family heavy metal efflux RND transporter [Gammaproteobacteria bacterium]|nr:CusA/CzcA family heavy metal efflux RND transporter [Gammaproteobacteria bacterium]